MGIKLANNVSTTLSAGIDAVATTLTLNSTAGLPTLATGDYFYATLSNADETIHEIVKVTSLSPITIERAQDETTASAWSAGDSFSLRPCRAAMMDLAQGHGIAAGNWQAYTPIWTSLSNPQPAIGNGSLSAWWRRVGDSLEVLLTLTVGSTTSFGTDEWYFSLPSGLTLGSATGPLGTAMAYDSSATQAYFGSVLAQGTNKIRVLTGLNWRSSHPMAWASGDYIFLRFTAQIAGWNTNINLAQDFREYACNSSTTTTDDLTSFSSSPDGAFVKAFSPSGTNSVRKRVRFSSPVRHSDLLMLQVSLTTSGDDWVDYRDISWGMTTNSSGSEFYGMGLRRVPESATDVDINFWSRPLAGSFFAWPSSDIYRWRVVKISGGNFAESGNDSYSTLETLTNKKWINGKPIYRKVVVIPAMAHSVITEVPHGITGATEYTKIHFIAKQSDRSSVLGTIDSFVYVSSQNIGYKIPNWGNPTSGKVILEYVK